MKALILAGGYGTRLRPLSCTRPKLLFPVANRPVLDWILEGLARSGVEEVILAVGYMADMLMREFGNEKYGLALRYSREERSLGTGGPVKRAEKFLREEDSFLVLNGDILSSIDYEALIDFHEERAAVATIALHEVEEPSRFGVVDIDEGGRIGRFVEKPKAGLAPSNLINAGVYALSPSIFEYTPRGEERFMLETTVFPRVASSHALYGKRFDGLWVDIGTPIDYLNANYAMVDLLFKRGLESGKNRRKESDIEIKNPVVIGGNVKIGKKACLGPHTVLGDGVEVGEGTRVERCVVFKDAFIDSHASLRGAIIGESAFIGKWVKIEEQAIVGDHVMIWDNSTLTRNVVICPNKEIEESVLEQGRIM